MSNDELLQEIERLKAQFPAAEENKLNALEALIEQAAFERLYLKKLNEQAMVSGLLKVHPNNPAIQQSLPVSNEISKHSAALVNIMTRLMRFLTVEQDDEDDDLDEYQ